MTQQGKLLSFQDRIEIIRHVHVNVHKLCCMDRNTGAVTCMDVEYFKNGDGDMLYI